MFDGLLQRRVAVTCCPGLLSSVLCRIDILTETLSVSAFCSDHHSTRTSEEVADRRKIILKVEKVWICINLNTFIFYFLRSNKSVHNVKY